MQASRANADSDCGIAGTKSLRYHVHSPVSFKLFIHCLGWLVSVKMQNAQLLPLYANRNFEII